MAITITDTPPLINAAYRPIEFTATSNDGDIVRMIADVYVNGAYEMAMEEEVNINTTNEFTFDVSEISRNAMNINTLLNTTLDFSDNITAFSLYNSSVLAMVALQVRLFEVVDTTAGTLFTTWDENGTGTGSTNSGLVYALNATLQHDETQNLDAYSVDTSAKLFLTKKPRTEFKITRDTNIQLDFIMESVASIKARIAYLDDNDTPLSTTTSATELITVYKSRVLIHGASFPTDATHAKVFLLTSGNAALSEQIDIRIIDPCEYTLLVWQNVLGGYDYWYFEGNRVEVINSKSNTFTKPLRSVFNVKDRGEQILSIDSNKIVTVTTDNIHPDTLEYLLELNTHGLNAFVYDGSQYLPIIIEDAKKTFKNDFDKVLQFEVTFSYANKKIAQRQ